MIEFAKKYHSLGFRVIPVGENKRPMLPRGEGWKKYRDAQSVHDIERIFGKGESGIAILTGIDGLEVIDVDQKYSLGEDLLKGLMATVKSFCPTLESELFLISRTKSGGYHVMYRCDEIEGNQKLAQRPTTESERDGNEKDTVRVLLETRGIGGYVVAYPTPGYTIESGKFSSIPRVSPDERRRVISAAKSFNEVFDLQEETVRTEKKDGRKTTIDDFNERGESIVSMLGSAGWTISGGNGHRIFCRRPGSKVWSGNYHQGHGVFVCFSTSTDFEPGRAYNRFGVYAVLNHSGDYSSAAKKLYSDGYGDRFDTQEAPAVAAKEMSDKITGLVERVYAKKFDFDSPPLEGDYVLRLKKDFKWFDVATFGMMVLITGLAKSRKTTFLVAWLASALSGGKPFLNFHFEIGDRKIVWFDTEQPERYFYRTHKNIHKLAGKTGNQLNYEAFSLRKFTVLERLEFIDWYVNDNDNLGIMVLDGILDLVENFNDIKESGAVVEKVMQWCERGVMVIPVIHRNRYSGFTMGNLGSKLEKKCDACIELENDVETNFSSIKCKLSRTMPFEPFDFTHNTDGYPVLDHNQRYDIDLGPPMGTSVDFDHVPSPERQAELNAPAQTLVDTLGLEPSGNWGTVKPSKMTDDEDIPF